MNQIRKTTLPFHQHETLENLFDFINQEYPIQTVTFEPNVDDFWASIDFCPAPFTTIRIMCPLSNDYSLRILSYSIQWWRDEQKVKLKTLFNGTIPSDENHHPDFGFIYKIIRNYQSML